MAISTEHFDRWEVAEFKLLQVLPAGGFQAVYAEDDEANPGKFKLVASKLAFLALAERTTRSFSRPKNAPKTMSGEEYGEPGVANVLVGLDMAEGGFMVCEALDNFAGYCLEGGDITEATGHLVMSHYPLSV